MGTQREEAMAGADCFTGTKRLAVHMVMALYQPELVLSHAAGRGEVGSGESVKLGPERCSFRQHSALKQT